MLAFVIRGLASRDDADGMTTVALAVTDEERPTSRLPRVAHSNCEPFLVQYTND